MATLVKRETMQTHATGRTALEAARAGGGVRPAAGAAKLSLPMVVWARRVLRFGVPELIVAVEEGKVAIYFAAEMSRFDAERQRQFLTLALTRCGDRTISARCFAPQPASCPRSEHEA